jgi:hypothetical protein
LLYLLRWFWWRINGWCEVAAMLSSFFISLVFFILKREGTVFSTDYQLIFTVICTTICWVATAYLGPQTDKQTLIDFYKKVQPFGPGWKAIHLVSGVSDEEVAAWKKTDNIPLAMVGWVTGTVLIWSALFTVGNFLYGRLNYGFGLLAVAVVSGVVLIGVVRRIWR